MVFMSDLSLQLAEKVTARTVVIVIVDREVKILEKGAEIIGGKEKSHMETYRSISIQRQSEFAHDCEHTCVGKAS
jgi:hypothetical protein